MLEWVATHGVLNREGLVCLAFEEQASAFAGLQWDLDELIQRQEAKGTSGSALGSCPW